VGRAALQACLPWLGLLLASSLAACLVLRVSQSRPRLGRLWQLHRDEAGSVQSLSFVLTLPIFIWIMMFIVQVSQLMIGTIVVHYAAFAAARSAAVWIPAALSGEGANCVGAFSVDPSAADQQLPVLDPTSPSYGPTAGGVTYIVAAQGPKYEQIRAAAAMACMPICPSRDLAVQLPGSATATLDALKRVYAAMVPSSTANTRINARLQNKLAYALQSTQVEVRFYHKNSEPPLIPPDPATGGLVDIQPHELGWQDPITVTVKHNFALLPGPGRLLSHVVPGPTGTDQVSSRISQNGAVYVYPLTASATIDLEGEKAVVPYAY
jgi:hypothetical protein